MREAEPVNDGISQRIKEVQQFDRVNYPCIIVDFNEEVDGAHYHKWKPGGERNNSYNKGGDSETLAATSTTLRGVRQVFGDLSYSAQ